MHETTNRGKIKMKVLMPAYGRDYKSKADLLKDWDDKKDFILNDYTGRSGPINKDQVEVGESLQFRYKKLTVCFVHKNK